MEFWKFIMCRYPKASEVTKTQNKGRGERERGRGGATGAGRRRGGEEGEKGEEKARGKEGERREQKGRGAGERGEAEDGEGGCVGQVSASIRQAEWRQDHHAPAKHPKAHGLCRVQSMGWVGGWVKYDWFQSAIMGSGGISGSARASALITSTSNRE